MAQAEFLRLVPNAPEGLCQILDPDLGAPEPPIRSEIFGLQRFAQHGRSLGETHRAALSRSRGTTFFPRLQSNILALRAAHRYIGSQADTGYDISPAAEWLLDNFHLIEAQLKAIREGLPRSYFRALPVLLDAPLAGLPRVYGVAWAFVAHTDGAFDEALAVHFLAAYQETRELTLGETWALPTTLRVVLIEDLRRLAERVATHKAAREAANLCSDRIETYSLHALDQVLALMNRRGVGRAFLAQMASRLQDHPAQRSERVSQWLHRALPDLAAQRAQQAADQAADNLSVSNAVTSLRTIGDADWADIVARTSGLMRLMLTSPIFAAEAAVTRDQTLHRIEKLALRSRRSEVAVAQALLGLMQAGPGPDPSACSAGHWLQGAGRPALAHALGLDDRAASQVGALARRVALPAYLGAVLLATAALLAWVLRVPGAAPPSPDLPLWWALAAAALALLPASEAAVAVINRLISESVRPHHLPRLALAQGIPPEHRVLVVIPGLLTSSASTLGLAHRLQLHHLANPENHAQFALLTDWPDAPAQTTAADDALLADATQQVQALNLRYPNESGRAPRFIVLHRGRHFSPTEQRWIGWERKRGKLELLVAELAVGASGAFVDLGELSRVADATPYIVTLDSDTQLPPGRLRELVGAAAHPRNQPRLDASGHNVAGGYGILQPRVVTPLPAPQHVTPFHALFAGQCGIDPYSAATSEVYQDLFGEGTFTGKGLLHVQAMHAVLAERLPEGQVLSHDLLEGAMARCCAATDITVIEDAPFHADVAASRLHRWTRGDWQLLPFLLQPWRHPLRAVNRWKMFDNLRRSLVAPASLALLLLALTSGTVSPWRALALVFAAFSAGPMMGAVAGFAPSRDDIAKRHFYRQAGADFARAVGGGLWHLAQLLQQALMSVDAIARALYRMVISRRHLLQWTTAATAQAAARNDLAAVARQHWSEPVVALLLLGALLALGTPTPALAVALCLLWAASPVTTWWVSRPRARPMGAALSDGERDALHATARDTWRLFERCVGPEDHYLPPDNLQTLPHDMVAHRTSPTNIGLYLLGAACARQFGWIGTQDLLDRAEATLATLDTLQRHHGHFLNWYDTQTCAPLLPMYVSTVDSGNLSGHLLALAQACRELALAPLDTSAGQQALQGSMHRLQPLLTRELGEPPALAPGGALARLLARTDPLVSGLAETDPLERLLNDAAAEIAAPAAVGMPQGDDELSWCLADHLATLRSAWRDVRAGPAGADAAALRLRALAERCERLAWQADFAFLYHPTRHLLHIGFRVAEQQLDAGFYDLLASESRLTSLLAIAKGDVPVRHWAALGRPFFAVGATAGLRSWSGSMFEYLMPSLVLDEPHGSVLLGACCAALDEQMAFAQARHVPWGISESAYAGSDHTLAYQYAPQGVPRLALRRTPPGELVIAPYATALAAQIAPHLASLNFGALRALAANGRYGFMEALDYSPARRSGPEAFQPVRTFMAHHQGMTIVALANVLLGGVAQRWGMANPHIEAVASLLHERAPREVSPLPSAPLAVPAKGEKRRALGLLREVSPGSTAVEPTHLLSNGTYSVTLRANGAGGSRWGGSGLTRWRDDALRDALGTFFFLRRNGQPKVASLTQHPAPDPAAQYQSTFHADRVCFDATWPDLQTHVTVWVSPEDDIEFRQVELRNLGDRALDVELISTFEVTLADRRADEAHPAFSNLFVRAEWQAAQQAIVFERKPRLASERGLQAAHFLAQSDPQATGVRIQTDRQRWLGRNRSACQPLASFDDPPPPADETRVRLDTGLDPVCALSVRVRLAPGTKAQLTFATAASDNGGVLSAVIDKYRQPSHVQRASLMSATLAGIRLRSLRISPDNFAAIQSLTTALLLTLTRPDKAAPPAGDGPVGACDRRLLWRLGISGDRPIVLVSASAMQGLGMLRSLAQALRLWAWGGVACDLVMVNAEPASYQMALQREMVSLRERHASEADGSAGPAMTALHVLRAEELSTAEIATLNMLARVHFNADGRPLLHHLQAWVEAHEQAFEARHDISTAAVAVSAPGASAAPTPRGRFEADSGDFGFEVGAQLRPARPWINVLSNPAFGAQVSETGAGYTWALNSRLNQLTAWSNDPVADPPGEWFLLQDLRTRQVWSVAPSAWGDAHSVYRITHGQGRTRIVHSRDGLEVTADWCVDATTAVKQVRIGLVNRGVRARHLRLVGIAEWLMGAGRADRGSVQTALYRQRLPAGKLTALLGTQQDHAAGFGNGTAFLAAAGATDESEDWTCDRREFFDARGRLVVPDHFGQRSGAGLDPCAALSLPVSLARGESVERVYLIGYATSPDAARRLAAQAAATSASEREATVRRGWDRLLGTTHVVTPDPLFDALVNHWLLYQAVSCRLWAKAGFYQAGGATGFRDQLQDAMALSWAAPSMLREQILRCASRQFEEGDVQHWWHTPGGAGVRTHFSDDLLWLAHACVHYLRATGDAALLDEQVPFIEGAPIPKGAEDAYYTPSVSSHEASVYEHAARAIDRSLRVGVHGLPLMGSGDWNDGMNRIGSGGRGESVWLAWFLCRLVADFAPLAHGRGDGARAMRWEDAAQGWRAALGGAAWDGQWFRRAFFDDGQAFGSQANPEARIDLIAQAWAVLSGAAPAASQRMALDAVEQHLVDHDAGLIRLLDPPLVHAEPSAGYIQAYPPGVRENGGQYSHGAVWALMAQAEYATSHADTSGSADLAYRYFTFLSPAHRSDNAAQRAAYGIEPYVMAGDVYTQPPYVGRGGWSWYTGAAAWMHRAAVESIFGLRLEAQVLSFKPCLPAHWPQAELTLQRDGRRMRFILLRGSAQQAADAAANWQAQLLSPGEPLSWPGLDPVSCFVVPLPP